MEGFRGFPSLRCGDYCRDKDGKGKFNRNQGRSCSVAVMPPPLSNSNQFWINFDCILINHEQFSGREELIRKVLKKFRYFLKLNAIVFWYRKVTVCKVMGSVDSV